MMIGKCLSLLLTLWFSFGGSTFVPPPCAPTIVTDPLVSDLVTASEHVSWDDSSFQGKRGWYDSVITCEMQQYDTRMRIYQKRNDNESFIVFRPTQQTWNGGSIHAERYVTPTRFLSSQQSIGNVHQRFQDAFVVMHDQCAPFIKDLVSKNQTIFITGHSLGGSFSLFMANKLFYDYHVSPKAVYGFAGTFIGDETFHTTLETPLRSQFPLWLIEVVDINNVDHRDGTSEGYQTFDNQLDIDPSMICGFYIVPLGSDQSYGLHDLKNYWKAVEANE